MTFIKTALIIISFQLSQCFLSLDTVLDKYVVSKNITTSCVSVTLD